MPRHGGEGGGRGAARDGAARRRGRARAARVQGASLFSFILFFSFYSFVCSFRCIKAQANRAIAEWSSALDKAKRSAKKERKACEEMLAQMRAQVR